MLQKYEGKVPLDLYFKEITGMAQGELKYFQVGLATLRCLKIKCMEVNKHKRSTRKYNDEKVPKIPTLTCDRETVSTAKCLEAILPFPSDRYSYSKPEGLAGKVFYFYHDTQCPPPRICTHCTIIFQKDSLSHIPGSG